MAQVLHGSARTTATVCRAIQASQASIRSLAQQYGINPKTVAKWKYRSGEKSVVQINRDYQSLVVASHSLRNGLKVSDLRSPLLRTSVRQAVLLG